MIDLSLKQLAEIIGSSPNVDGFFKGISIDSRTTEAGDCFFAIAGENFDGHNYIAAAFEKGASCAVSQKCPENITGPVLKVPDTVTALGDLARWYRDRYNFKVIAITGSAGKTTTRRITADCLKNHFKVTESRENFNNFIGLPLTILSADAGDEIIVAELGSNAPGEIEYLSKIARPDIALITNTYPCHLEGLKNIETIVDEKISIVKGLTGGGIFIINADCKILLDSCRSCGLGFISFGRAGISDMNVEAEKNSFYIDKTKVTVPLPGTGNLENALAAWTICRQLGVTKEQFARDINKVTTPDMRTKIKQAGSVTVIDDCYNANPASMKNALEILSVQCSADRRAVFICGDMAELGPDSEKYHEQLAGHIINANVKLLITAGPLSKLTADAVRDTAHYDIEIVSFLDVHEVCNNMYNLIRDFDIVLTKGSRSAGLEKAVETIIEHFS